MSSAKIMDDGTIVIDPIQVTNEVTGIPFYVLIEHNSEKIAENFSSSGKKEAEIRSMSPLYALVKIYDSRFTRGTFAKNKHEDILLGQFVSSYYLQTLRFHDVRNDLRAKEPTGINLHGGVDDWYLTEKNMRDIFQYIDGNMIALQNAIISSRHVTESSQSGPKI